MSSSDVMGKIEFTDTKERIAEKFKKAYCVERQINDNPCLSIAKLIVFPIKGSMGCYNSYYELTVDWVEGKIYAGQLKEMLTNAIDEIIDPIRRSIEANRQLYDDAFPAVEPLLVEVKPEPVSENKVEVGVGDKRKTYTIEQIHEKIQQKAQDTFLHNMQKLRYECDMGEL